MSISVQYDKNAQKMVLKTGNDLVAAFDAKEASQFRKEYEQALLQLQSDYRTKTDDYAEIIMEDFESWMESSSDNNFDLESDNWVEEMKLQSNIVGIDIEVRWVTQLEYATESIFLLKEDGTKEYFDIPDNLMRNFTVNQIQFGQASSRQIRRCFDNNVLQMIEENPNFVVKFCGAEVPRTSLFSDEKELFFDFGTSSDT